MGMLHLDAATLDGLGIGAEAIVDRLSNLIRQAEDGSVFAAPKAVLTPPDGRYVMATLAATTDPAYVATKSLVLNERNSARGLPQINSLVTLLDGETGEPLATLNGNWITAVRTAGISALAATYLARKDARRIGCVGTGVQAQSHLTLFAQLFPLDEVVIWGRGQPNRDKLASLAETLGLSVTQAATPQEAIIETDIALSTITHTAVSEPFLSARDIATGGMLLSADLSAPWHQADFKLLDQLFVDDSVQEAALPNKLADPADLTGDLSDLVSGRRAGRGSPEERTGFTFRGHALGDLALAIHAYEEYRAKTG